MKNKSKILPVLFGFFIMGFCDLVGVSVTYAKDYFSWSETQAGFLPSMVFIWFLLISIPISIWMDKKGRKTISLIGLLSTFIGMLLPLLTFTQTACYIAFALLGIGNTILQVSLNPLLTNVIAEGKLSSIMTAGQFIKALSSFVGTYSGRILLCLFQQLDINVSHIRRHYSNFRNLVIFHSNK